MMGLLREGPMTRHSHPGRSLHRRSFLAQAAVGGLAASAVRAAGAAETTELPAIKLGKHSVTRLIAGYNPVGGYGHSVPKLNAIMKDWFTPQRTLDFVRRLEKHGINTWQAGIDPKVQEALRVAWEGGSKMQWICVTPDLDAATWKMVAALKPVAVLHHGENTDRLFRAGQGDKIRDFLKKAHDLGLIAGISSHSPQNIARCEDSNWEQDLYMTCFYDIRRDQEKVQAGLGDLPVDEMYLAGDPQRMTAVVRQVKRPCLGFKILAAGRLCGSRGSIERAFAFAYSNIKATDAVIVGMFPILTDEIAENAEIARKLAKPA
jgi:hypothetical protein